MWRPKKASIAFQEASLRLYRLYKVSFSLISSSVALREGPFPATIEVDRKRGETGEYKTKRALEVRLGRSSLTGFPALGLTPRFLAFWLTVGAHLLDGKVGY